MPDGLDTMWNPATMLGTIQMDLRSGLDADLFFDRRRIAPAPGEVPIFEVLLIIGFDLESYLLGFLVRWFLRRNQGTGVDENGSGPEVTGR